MGPPLRSTEAHGLIRSLLCSAGQAVRGTGSSSAQRPLCGQGGRTGAGRRGQEGQRSVRGHPSTGSGLCLPLCHPSPDTAPHPPEQRAGFFIQEHKLWGVLATAVSRERKKSFFDRHDFRTRATFSTAPSFLRMSASGTLSGLPGAWTRRAGRSRGPSRREESPGGHSVECAQPATQCCTAPAARSPRRRVTIHLRPILQAVVWILTPQHRQARLQKPLLSSRPPGQGRF